MASVLRANRVLAVARNTFREAVRNRAFVGVTCFAIAFILFSLILSELTVVGQGPRVVVDFGLYAISLFASATAILMGTLLVYKELEKKTIYTILSKPIRRHEFLLGKYLGMVGILAMELLVLGLIWGFVLWIQGGAFNAEHIKALVLIGCEASLVAAVGVMFSSQSTPALTGLFTLGVFVVGRVVYVLEEMLQASKGLFVDNPFARLFGQAVTAVFPDLSVFNVSQQLLLEVTISWAYLGQALLYATCYGLIVIAIGMLAFERRDFV
ncbi:MAG: ABC transporter permease [Myxococcota bacterium]|jgi:ABC-type transport system involved in multi-copper enzyme maturation permease subunit|nr:ABC transporter permease [Myxococcota bacterium]